MDKENLPAWIRSGASPAPEFQPPPESLCEGGDALAAFLRWYGDHGPAWPMAPQNGLWFTGGLPGLTLYQAGAFQVQLFIFPAGTEVPEHRHPHVDTIELRVAGDFDFRVAGISSIPLDFLADRRGPVSRWWGRGVRVRPGDWHDLSVGASGAAFLSVQHWLQGEPSTVGLDWEGRPVNKLHAEALCPR